MNFEIRFNGVPRTYRDLKDVAYEAALFLKKRNRGDIIEVIELFTGEKVQVLEDGRIA
jgi:hypothetical protein